jgi:chromosome segregation ATPase
MLLPDSSLSLEATAARTGLMAAEVILQMSERVSQLEQAVESSTQANETLRSQLDLALQREGEMAAEVSSSATQLKHAQELCARLLAEAETQRASAVAAAARAAVADDRAAQTHRAADAAVEKARAEAVQAAAALEDERRQATALLEEERQQRAAAVAEAQKLRADKQHLEELLQRLSTVVSSLTKRCATLVEANAHQQQPTLREVVALPSSSGQLKAALTTALRSAEKELSALDERLSNPHLTAEERAALRATMLKTGARIRKLAALRR